MRRLTGLLLYVKIHSTTRRKLSMIMHVYFKKSSLLSFLYHLFLFVFTLSAGYLVSALLNRAIEQDTNGTLQWAGVLLALLLMGLPIIYGWSKKRNWWKREDRQRFYEEMYRRVIDRKLNVNSTGDLAVKLSNDSGTVAAYYQDTLPAAAEGIAIMLGSAVLLCLKHLPIGLLFFAMSLLHLIPTLVYEKWAKQVYEQTDEMQENYDSWLVQGHSGIRSLKAYRQERWFIRHLTRISEDMISAGMRAEKTGTIETVVFQLIDSILRYGGYIIMGFFILNGGLRVSDTPVLIVLSGYLFSAVKAVLELFLKHFEFQVARERLQVQPEILRQPPEQKAVLLKAEHISKRYEDKEILKDVSLSIKEGERLLVHGKNGSGKSTLLNILLGFTRADTGVVTAFSDVEALSFALQEEADVPLTGLQITQALQNTKTLDMSAFGKHLKGFAVTEEILKQPMRALSMGERKKFYLAAALSKKARLLVLDEPLNHLDAAARAYLYQQLRAHPGALLMISHEQDILVPFDRTITLEGGGAL